MVPLTVPEQDRRIVLRSFWFLISLGAAVIAGTVGWLLHIVPWICAALGFLTMVSIALVNEHLARRVYHAWNNRIIRPLSNVASTAILRICHLLVFTATGKTGSRLRLSKDGVTLWMARDSGFNHTTRLPFAASTAGRMPNGWIRTYLRWAVQTRNLWAIFLIPFFCLLRMVSAELPGTDAGNIYTLF
jgi:hypothetical protein